MARLSPMSTTATAVSVAAPQARSRPRIRHLALLVLVAGMLALAAAFVGYRAATPTIGPLGGIPWTAEGATLGPGTAEGLKPGDVVTGLAGRSLDTWLAALTDPAATRPPVRADAPLRVDVLRNGQSLRLDVAPVPSSVGSVLRDSWGVLIFVSVMLAVGTAVYLRRPEEPAARALLVLGGSVFASTVCWIVGLHLVDLLTGTGFWLHAAGSVVLYSVFWGALLHLALVFPKPMPIVVRHPAILAAAYAAPLAVQLGAFGLAAAGGAPPLERMAAMMSALLAVQAVAVVLAFGLMVLGLRNRDPVARAQLRWVALGAGIGTVGGAVAWFGPELLFGEPLLPWNAAALIGLPFPLALGIAIQRHRLFEIDTVVNRSLVYGALTAAILLIYAAVVAALSGLLPTEAPYAVTLVAIGVVAVAALPLRDRLQRVVNRVMYGDRDEPHRAIARLGARLAGALDQRAVLPVVLETVTQALRLPYAAIVLGPVGDRQVVAEHGIQRGDEPLRLPLVHQGEAVGELVVAPRTGEHGFGNGDRQILTSLAQQVSATAYAVRLAEELQRSREQLITTREEERRRLRADLHDGLGPTLAGSLFKLQAARALLTSDPADADRLLDELATETRQAIDDVRQLARDLRPPALDELGLEGAVREQVQRFGDGADLDVRLEGDPLPQLPAAVEVAAYRIAVEALTNVVRHAAAREARVALRLADGALCVEVADDGPHPADGRRAGVGLTSMRERAAELGGTLEIGRGPRGGTRVVARLPVHESARPHG